MRTRTRLHLCISIFICWLSGTVHAQPAAPVGPNVVLTEAVFFVAPDGGKVTLIPGRYLVEQAGASELRLTPMSGGKSALVQAQALRHEQYELFSPFALTRPGTEGRFHITLLLPGGHQLEATGETGKPAAQPKSFAGEPPASRRPPIQQEEPATQRAGTQFAYVPPREAVSGGRLSGGTAGTGENLVRILPLAPDHVGLTTKEQPTLYWYLSRSVTEPVDVKLEATGAARPMFEVRLVPPLESGLHTINLTDFGVRLAPKTQYRWFVTFNASDRGKEVVGGASVMRVPIPDHLSAELVRVSKAEIPSLYAQSGIWYDALAAISELIVAAPTDSALHQQRASLLDQVGLADIAKLDRDAKLAGH